MSDRVHEALDGEIRAEDLTGEERVLFETLAGMTIETVEALRSVPAPDLTEGVMAGLSAVRNDPVRSDTGTRTLFSWLWRPRAIEVTWRPAYALAIVLVVAAAVSLTRSGESGPDRYAAVENMDPVVVYVQFRLESTEASTVALAGSFTDWAPGIGLTETAPGVWSALVPLLPGVHDYTFLIDGEIWVVDPTAPLVADGFGGVNSRLFLTRPGDNA